MEMNVPLSKKEVKKVLMVSFIAFVILMTAVLVSYSYARKYTSYVILPGGSGAYYGEPEKLQQTVIPKTPEPQKFFADKDTEWVQQKGKLFPYVFEYPKTMNVGVFPGDPHEPVTIFWQNTNSQETIFLRVELLNENNNQKYIALPKRKFVENWWKQYRYAGIASYKEITNKNGMKGYRVSYADVNGIASKYHFFFEVPQRPDLMIWMSSDIIDWSVFERMVESLSWEAK